MFAIYKNNKILEFGISPVQAHARTGVKNLLLEYKEVPLPPHNPVYDNIREVTPVKVGSEWVQQYEVIPNQSTVVAKILQDKFDKDTKDHILKYYSYNKQNSDTVDANYYATYITRTDTTLTLDAVYNGVSTQAAAIITGKTDLATVVATYPAKLQEGYQQLIKAGIRVGFVQACKLALRTALSEIAVDPLTAKLVLPTPGTTFVDLTKL